VLEASYKQKYLNPKTEEEKISSTEMSEKKSNVSSRSNGKMSKVKNFFKNKSKKKEKNKEPT
jgi:hypothetical protein|tara:strand:- start:440 stop:625 length:186 start_codon:yes stop_codon:yes gene_type:complete